MTRKPPRSRGQGMTEYIIIVALISIGTIGVVTVFGDNVRRLFAMSADALAGNASVAQANSVGAVERDALNKKTLRQFAQNVAY